LRETSKVLRILGNQNEVIERFIVDSDKVVGELERNKRDVVRFVKEAGDTAEISASRREQLRQTFRKLPEFLGELEPTMARLGELTDAQNPLLADLERASPSLRTFLERLGPFAEATRPAIRSLGKAGVTGRRAFRRGSQEVTELRRLARDVPATGRYPDQQGVAKPLRQFVQTIDDRRRATEDDSRARASEPPAPDPTHIPPGRAGGFTGLEAVWDYFFWQALTINAADDVGHVLKLSGVVNDCRPYRVRRDPEDHSFDRCRQWLGPYQPGINAPDPTEGGARPARGRGGAEAPPRPGGADASRPQLPPGLGKAAAATAKPPDQAGADALSETQLLDFLLAP
jgi:hypothetical protein